MALIPQHPDNPCRHSLPEAEQVPAKIWELLRRNEKFKRTFARFQELDRRLRVANDAIKNLLDQGACFGEASNRGIELETLRCERDGARTLSDRMLELIGSRHGFVAIALRWLVPEPWFEIQELALQEDEESSGKNVAVTKCVKLQGGPTPHPIDWLCFWASKNVDANSIRSRMGRSPWVRGPMVIYHVSEDPRILKDPINGIEEWIAYQKAHGSFALVDSWRFAPQGFKRAFCRLWRRVDSRQRNPITGERDDVPSEHEVTFFQGWRLWDATADASQRGNLVGEDIARALRFDDLSRNYRVFAIPKSILSKGEANRLGKWLARELSKGLRNQIETLGNATEWNTWLRERQTRTAEGEHIDSHYYRRRHYMDSLCANIYPTFDTAKLLTPPKHRARYKPYVPKGGQS